MKKLLFTTIFLATNLLQVSIAPARSTPLPTAPRIAEIDRNDELLTPQGVQQIAKSISVRISSANNGGSGVLIAQKGNNYLVLTNAHVVKQAAQLEIQAPDGQKYQAKLINGGFSPKYDLALLQFTSKTKYSLANLTGVGDGPIEPSRTIYSAGFPFDSKDIRITSGKVSQLTDIPFDDGTQIGYIIDKGKKGIRQGMSGGAIFDQRGAFLGINTIGIAPILPNYTYNDGSKPIAKLKDLYTRANWGIPVYNFLTNVKADILYGYDNLPKVVHQATPSGYIAGLNNNARKMTVRIENSDGNGSGVIVAKEGNSYYVLTAKHVVQDEKLNTHQKFTDSQIITYDQDSHPVTSTVVAEGVDLAVIKFTSSSTYPIAKLGQYNTKDDDLAFVGGFPGRDKIKSPLWQWQLNPGFMFSKERGKLMTQNDQSFTNGYDLIYGSISYGGMSGGPVFDTAGNIIGIHGRGEGADLNSLGISIQTFIGLAKANKLQIAPNLLKIDRNHPSNLSAADRGNVIAAMQNLSQPQEVDPGKLWLDYGNQLYRTRQYDRSIAAFDKAIVKDKQLTIAGNYGKALVLIKAKKLELATTAIAQAIAAAPTNPKERVGYYYLWGQQSTILRKRRKFDEALKAIDIAISLKSDDLNLQHEKAANLFGQRKYTAAITILNDLIRIKAEWYFYSARSSDKSMLGDDLGAIEDANMVIKLNPDFENAYIHRASIELKMGDLKSAMADVNQAIKLNPNSSFAYSTRANVKNSGDNKGAMEDINRAIQIDREDASYYATRADIKDSSKKYKEAIEDVNRAIQIDPYNFYYYVTRGTIKSHSGDNLGAIADYTQAIKMDSNYDIFYLSRGLIKIDIGDINGALEDANRAIAINPNFADHYAFRASIKYFKKGDNQGALDDYNRAIKIAPKYANYYSGRGGCKSGLGDYQGGIADFSKAIELDHKNAQQYYLSRGDAKLKLGNKQGAIDDYKESIKFEPKTNFDYVHRGKAKLNLEDYRGAISDYSKAIELDPKNFNTYVLRAVAKFKIGDYQGGIIDQNKIIELEPKNANHYYIRAFAKSKIGDKKGSIADLNKAIEFNSKNSTYYLLRGGVKLELGDKQGAIDDYIQAIKINPKYAGAYDRIADIKIELGDKQGAIEYYDRAIKFAPDNANYYTIRGLLKSDIGDKQGAILDLSKSIELNPKYALTYGSRGDVKLGLGDKQGAIADYTQAIKLNPKYAGAYRMRGFVKSDLGNKQEAILDYNKAIEINPKDGDAYISRGVAKFELGDNVRAMADTKSAIVINPNSALASANLGAFKIIDGKEREALPDLERAIKLDPKMSYAYAGRGIVRETLGDKQGAISDYKQALKLNPQILNEWKKQAESVRKYNPASYQKYQQMILKLEAGSKLN